MRAGGMIDRIPAAARRAALERAELVDQARIVEQLDATAVDQRQQHWDKGGHEPDRRGNGAKRHSRRLSPANDEEERGVIVAGNILGG